MPTAPSDALFILMNSLVGFGCLASSLSWDTRAAALMIVVMPSHLFYTVLADSTLSHLEFRLRPYFYTFQCLIFLTRKRPKSRTPPPPPPPPPLSLSHSLSSSSCPSTKS